MSAHVRRLIGETAARVFGFLPAHYKRFFFLSAAESAGIPSFRCEGSLGSFEGSAADSAVFRNYVLTRTWAPAMRQIMLELFPEDKGTYIDIGSNIGLTVVPLAREKRGIVCYAFEPEPNNFFFLRNNIEANSVSDRVTAYPYAVFSADTDLEMEFSPHNRGDHRIRLRADSHLPDSYEERERRTYRATARRLDTVLGKEPLKKPVVVKIDVQGAEVDVLRGGAEILAQTDFLFVEFWPYGLVRLGHSAEQLLKLIMDFRCGSIVEESGPPAGLVPIEQIVKEAGKIPFDGSRTDHLDFFLSR